MTLSPFWLGTLPSHNTTVCDTTGTLVAVVGFISVLYAPGYVLAFAANLFGFRRHSFAERSITAIACSFMAIPIAAYFLGRVTGLTGVCALAIACFAATVLLLATHRNGAWLRRDKISATLLVAGWIIFVLLMLVDFQHGHKLYFSVVMADQSYRIAFTDAVARTGIPPANPLYFSRSAAAMHYYYFWYILCAAVMKLAHVTARQAFIASSVWGGFGLMATVRLFSTHFFHWPRRSRWIALGLLAVTGADLLPSVGNAILQPCLNGDIEWWSVDPIGAWPDSLLWVPHHVAAVLCCLLAFLLIWRTRGSIDRKQTLWTWALASLSFASAFGLSVYVACGFFMLIATWLVWVGLRRRSQAGHFFRSFAVVAIGCTAMLTPFVVELVHTLPRHVPAVAATAGVPAPHLFVLSVRRMIDSELLTGTPFFAAWNKAHPVLLDQSVRLALLLPGLAMELGIYGAVLVLYLRSRRRRRELPSFTRDTALFLTVSGLLITMFVSSSVISNNDFGYRAVMLPQFFLLLLAVDLFHGWSSRDQTAVVVRTPLRHRVVTALLFLGIAGTVYGAVLLRAWLPIEEHAADPGFAASPQDAYDVREAFAMFNRTTPRNAVIAFQPLDPTIDRRGAVMTPFDYFQRSLVMDTGRQILNAEGKCATHFGGDGALCPAIQMQTQALYASPAPSAAWAKGFCEQFGVQYLLIDHRDAAWNDRTGWPSTLAVVAAEPGLRIVQCAR